jgi:hypothetical protein
LRVFLCLVPSKTINNPKPDFFHKKHIRERVRERVRERKTTIKSNL